VKKFLCAILCYNNKITITKVVKEKKKLNNLCDFIFINDGSTDGTKKILKSLKLLTLNHKKNLGYGHAVKSAFKYAKRNKYEYLAIFPADNQRYASDLIRMIKIINSSNFHLVIGSKYEILKNIPFHRKVGNLLFSKIAKIFWNCKIKDVLSGFKVYKVSSFYKYLNFLPSDYSFDVVISQIVSFDMMKFREENVRCRYNKYTTSMKGIFKFDRKNILFISFKMIVDILLFYLKFRFRSKFY